MASDLVLVSNDSLSLLEITVYGGFLQMILSFFVLKQLDPLLSASYFPQTDAYIRPSMPLHLAERLVNYRFANQL